MMPPPKDALAVGRAEVVVHAVPLDGEDSGLPHVGAVEAPRAQDARDLLVDLAYARDVAGCGTVDDVE